MPSLLHLDRRRRRRRPTEMGKCLVRATIFLHSVQTFLGFLHLSSAVRLTFFLLLNSELFGGKAWFLMRFFIVGPFAIVSMALLYVQLTTIKTIVKERTVGMNTKEYKNQIYLVFFVVLIAVANFYFHTSSKIRFNMTLQTELKRMMFEYHSSVTSKDVFDYVQVHFECCGSEEPMDWIEEREKQLEIASENIQNTSIFPASCCIRNVCGSGLDYFLLHNDSANDLSLWSLTKRSGCIEKLRKAIAAMWMGSSFLFFLLPVIVEMAFVIILFLARIVNEVSRSIDLDFTNDGIIIGDNTINLSQHNTERFDSTDQLDGTSEYNLDLKRQNSESAPRNEFENYFGTNEAAGTTTEIPVRRINNNNGKIMTETWI